jgi:hypothetical protein
MQYAKMHFFVSAFLTLVLQVVVFVDASEADEFSEVASKPLRSLPYDSPGQTFVAFEKPEGVLATGKFSNILKFIVKEVFVSNASVFINIILIEQLPFINISCESSWSYLTCFSHNLVVLEISAS